MKIGIAFANIVTFAEPEGMVELATAAEAAGFESLWTVEHVIYPDNYESTYPYDKTGKMPAEASTSMPDPLIWLAMVGAHTSKIRLATGILILPERNPLVLAKQVATLDMLTGGRFDLGIGVGWLHEEFDALGIPWERRGQRTDEYVDIIRTLWSGDSVSFEGEFHNFSGISSNPKPANGTVPIVIGGHSPAAARRAGRLGDGFFPAGGNIIELVDIVRQTAADAGRDPAAIEITFPGDALLGSDPVAAAEEMRAAGVDRLIVPSYIFLGDTAQKTADFGEKVVAPIADI